MTPSEQSVTDLVRLLPLPILWLDDDGRIEQANPSASLLLGWNGSSTSGMGMSEYLDDVDSRYAFDAMANELDTEAQQRPGHAVSALPRDLRIRRGDLAAHTITAHGIRLPDVGGRLVVLQGGHRSDSARSTAPSGVAQHDALTGLPTRAALLEVLRGALAQLDRHPALVGVLFLDLDHMKAINDRLGHQAGDLFLCDVASRLRATVRTGDVVARLGGDEFVVAIPDAESVAQVQRIARRLAGVVRQPLVTNAERIDASVSIGIAVTDDPSALPETLLRDSDAAMYVSKRQRGGEPVLFDSSLRDAVEERVRVEADLRQGLTGGEIAPYYQPIVTMEGEVKGAEALVRWLHPDRGLLSPAEFLPLAEETGLVHDLWLAVLQYTCDRLSHWILAPGDGQRYVSVNLSARQFGRPDLLQRLAQARHPAELPPSALCLEITETALMDDPLTAHRLLDSLAAEGYGLALDDFGTGYSSLSHLQDFPVTMVKIDASFTKRVLDSPRNAAIVRAVIELGEALGLSVCVEGVETQRLADTVARMGCRLAQGYHFGRPVTATDFIRRWKG